jgi:hypothetical protein
VDQMTTVIVLSCGVFLVWAVIVGVVMAFTKTDETYEHSDDDQDPDNPDLARWEDNGGPPRE